MIYICLVFCTSWGGISPLERNFFFQIQVYQLMNQIGLGLKWKRFFHFRESFRLRVKDKFFFAKSQH
jgi:hypothetical protein